MKKRKVMRDGRKNERIRSSLAVIPGIGAALLPNLTCPACWPAYAGILSSLGVGYLNYTPYLFPITTVFLAFAVASLGFRARSRRGFKPLSLGIIASAVVLTGKFLFNSNAFMYSGITLLMAASIWNAWPKKKEDECVCSSTNQNEIERKD